MRLALLGVDDEMLAVAASLNGSSHDEIVMIDALAARRGRSGQVVSQSAAGDRMGALSRFRRYRCRAGGVRQSDTASRSTAQIDSGRHAGASFASRQPVNARLLRTRHDSPRYPFGGRAESAGAIASGDCRIAIVAQSHDPSVLQSPLLGTIDQLVFERFLADRSRESVLSQFARDADLMQLFGGDAMTLHALGSGALGRDLGPYGNLAVQLACQRGVVCRWSVTPVEEHPGGRLTLVGSSGKAMLSMPMNRPWRMEIRSRKRRCLLQVKTFLPGTGAAAIDVLAAAIEGEDVQPSWSDAARTVELAETIDTSLARGRRSTYIGKISPISARSRER